MAYQKGEPVYRDKAKTVKEPGIWRLKDSKLYLAEVNYADPQTGKRIRERKTINRQDLAIRWRQTRKADALRGEISRRKKQATISFSKFAEEYFEAWKIERKDSTIVSEKNRIDGILKPHFGSRAIHTITRKDIEDFIVKRRSNGISTATANRELCRLKNMFGMAVNWGYLDTNPAAGIKQTREQMKEADYLTKEEVGRLLEVCDERIRPLVVTAVHTGMRWGELMALEWRDVSFKEKMKQITVRDPKNRENRHVPMNSFVEEALRNHQERQAKEAGGIVKTVFLNPDTGNAYRDLRKPYFKALEKAEIERHFTFHGLRHTAASHMVMAGKDIRTVGAILGHKDLKVTQRYAHLAPEHLREAVECLDYTLKEELQREAQ